MLLQVFKEWDDYQNSKSRNSGIDGTLSTWSARLVFITASKNQLLWTWSCKFSNSEIMTDTQNLGNQELMVSFPHRSHKHTASKNHKLSTCSYKFSKVEIITEWKSLQTGIDGKRSTACAHVEIINASENHLLSTCSYKLFEWDWVPRVQTSQLRNWMVTLHVVRTSSIHLS